MSHGYRLGALCHINRPICRHLMQPDATAPTLRRYHSAHKNTNSSLKFNNRRFKLNSTTISTSRSTVRYHKDHPIGTKVRNNRQGLRMKNFLIIVRTSSLRLHKRLVADNTRDNRYTSNRLVIRNSRAIRQRTKVGRPLNRANANSSNPVLVDITGRLQVRKRPAPTNLFSSTTRARLHITFCNVRRYVFIMGIANASRYGSNKATLVRMTYNRNNYKCVI